MKSFFTLAAFAAGSNALVGRTDGCCFHLTASGGASGAVGQLGDGQNRIGDNSLSPATYCIDSAGGITDSSGRGCIITPPSTQFQCDTGASPTTGFSVSSSGLLEFHGDSNFIACETGMNNGLNIYTTKSSSVTQCKNIQLQADSCSGTGAGASSSPVATPTPIAPAPAPSTPAGSVPASSAPAPSAPASSAPLPGPPTTVMHTITLSECTCPGAPAPSVPAPGTSSVAPAPAPTPAPSSSAPAPSESVPAPSSSPAPAPSESVPTPSSAPAPTPSTTLSSVPAPSGSPSPSAPASSVSTAPSSTSATSACATTLSSNVGGNFEYPHLIVPINSASPDTAAGTQYDATVSSTVSTIFNFDIPNSFAGQTCSLVFLFPTKAELQTSSFSFSGNGMIDVAELSSPAQSSTTFNNAPSVMKNLGVMTVAPGTNQVISTFACPAGQTVTFEMKNAGTTDLTFFEDYNPSPLGLFITVC